MDMLDEAFSVDHMYVVIYNPSYSLRQSISNYARDFQGGENNKFYALICSSVLKHTQSQSRHLCRLLQFC